MTFPYSKQVLYDNRIYTIESVSIINGQAFADATYRVHSVVHQVECDEVRLALGKRIKH